MKNFFRIVFTVLISLLTVLLSISIPFFLSVAAVIKPKSVVKIVQQVDYESILESNESLKKTAEKFKLSPQTVDTILKSDATAKIIEAYTTEATNILLELPTENGFTAQTVKDIVKNNIDEITDIAAKSPHIKVSEEKLENYIITSVDRNADKIINAFPELTVVEKVVKTTKAAKLIKNIINPRLAILAIVLVLLMSFLIYLLQNNRFHSLIWLGVDYALAAAGIAFLMFFSKHSLVNAIALQFSEMYSEIMAEAIYLCNDRMGIGFIALSFMTLVCIFIYYYLRNKTEFPSQEIKE